MVCKSWAIKLATEAARTVLSVDQIIVARQAGGKSPLMVRGVLKISWLQCASYVVSETLLTPRTLCLPFLFEALADPCSYRFLGPKPPGQNPNWDED